MTASQPDAACHEILSTPGVASIFTDSLLRGESPRVFEDGCQRRNFTMYRMWQLPCSRRFTRGSRLD
jgi:hypothetical protein